MPELKENAPSVIRDATSSMPAEETFLYLSAAAHERHPEDTRAYTAHNGDMIFANATASTVLGKGVIHLDCGKRKSNDDGSYRIVGMLKNGIITQSVDERRAMNALAAELAERGLTLGKAPWMDRIKVLWSK